MSKLHLNGLLLIIGFLTFSTPGISQEEKVNFSDDSELLPLMRNTVHVYTPINFYFDGAPLNFSPIQTLSGRKALSSLGVGFDRLLNQNWSLNLAMEYMDINYISLGHSRGRTAFPYQGATVVRSHFLGVLGVERAILTEKRYYINVLTCGSLRWGEEAIQISPTDPQSDHALLSGRTLLDPVVGFGVKAGCLFTTQWSFNLQLRFSQVVWRYDKDPRSDMIDIDGSSRRFFSINYGISYSWGNSSNTTSPKK